MRCCCIIGRSYSNGALDFVASHPTIVALCTRRHRVPTSDALVSGQHPSVNQDGTRANRGFGNSQAGVVNKSDDLGGTTGAASMAVRASWFLCHDTKAILLTSVPPRVLSHVQHPTSDGVVCSNQRGPHHPRPSPSYSGRDRPGSPGPDKRPTAPLHVWCDRVLSVVQLGW